MNKWIKPEVREVILEADTDVLTACRSDCGIFLAAFGCRSFRPCSYSGVCV